MTTVTVSMFSTLCKCLVVHSFKEIDHETGRNRKDSKLTSLAKKKVLTLSTLSSINVINTKRPIAFGGEPGHSDVPSRWKYLSK